MRSITITGYRRPRLFRDLLASLRANDLSGWRVFVQLEPSPEATELAAAATAMLGGVDHAVTVNAHRLGVRENPFRLLDRVFAGGSALNLYLEEDMLVAPDATRLALWYERHHQPGFLCLSLLAGGCGSAGMMSLPGHPALLYASRCFNSLGFVARRDEWLGHLRDHWMADAPHNCGPDGAGRKGWDWAIYHHLLRTPALRVVQPVSARATHTGREGGEHCTPEFHDLAFDDLPIAGDAASAYALTPVAELPPAARRHALLWEDVGRALLALADKDRAIAAARPG